MDLEKIIQELNRRFSQPVQEYYSRRIIVWYDEDGEFRDNISDIRLNDAEIIVLTGANTFAVKKLVELDEPGKNFLIYSPCSFERADDNWLLDIELYSEEFRADFITICMDEMKIPSTTSMRSEFKKYRKFFNAKARRDKVMGLDSRIQTPAEINLAVMSSICGIKSIKPVDIIRSVIAGGLDIEANEIYSEFVNYEIDHAFWTMVMQGTGFISDKPDIKGLLAHILIASASKSVDLENYIDYNALISTAARMFCYDLVTDWIHSDLNEDIFTLAAQIEDEYHIPSKLGKLELDNLVKINNLPCINSLVISKLLSLIGDKLISAEEIKSVVEMRRVTSWYGALDHYFEAAYQYANMMEFYEAHSDGFHLAEAEMVWKEYANDYYLMDTYYRKYHFHQIEVSKVYNAILNDLMHEMTKEVENLYNTWYLDNIGSNWTDVSKEMIENNLPIFGVINQASFYQNRISNETSRVFVIISDALRYEVAAELTKQLNWETQSKIELSTMKGVIPTATKFGMAALLPHREMKIETSDSSVKVLLDGNLESSENRQKILCDANPESVALKYKNIIEMKRADRAELVKGKQVVYIYHDRIDEASHISDKEVFAACEDAIVEIKNLIKIIVNEFGGTKIFVTSDHGFLYTYSPLTELDKVEKTAFYGDIIECSKRYAILREDCNPDYLLKVGMEQGMKGATTYVPKENIRIKVSGGSQNFVHGGTSLQEMVVPLIEYHHLRADSKAYEKLKDEIDTRSVEIKLLTAINKVTNTNFTLEFYQTEPVGSNREKAVYNIFMVDEYDNVITDTQRIIADKSSENAQDRTYACNFTLKPKEYSSMNQYYLVIMDEAGMERTRISFEIRVTFDDGVDEDEKDKEDESVEKKEELKFF